MAEVAGVDVSAIAGGFSGLGTGLGILVAVIVLGGAIVGAVWWYLEQQKYNKIVQVKRLYSGNTGKYFHDKAKQYTDKDGVTWWKLKGLRRNVVVPPEESMGITTKGSTIAFAVLDSNGMWTWVSHDFDFEAYKKDPKKNPRYEGISTESKANWAYQQRRNDKLRAGNWWKENAAQVISGMTLVMLVFGFFLFMPRAIEANTEYTQQATRTAQAQANAAEKMDEVLISINRLLENQGVQTPEQTENPPEAPN